jgi:cytochrome c peroxidase
MIIAVGCLMLANFAQAAGPLGLPDVPIPANNPQSAEKIALGERLYNDVRFSSTGMVSCATCHDATKVFTDSPLRVSEGINKLTGTRNAPTVVNSAYNKTQFWDGRSPDLEDQALHPPVNPVEMGLPNHDPILAIIREDMAYTKSFWNVFEIARDDISMRHVTMAIAAFERTVVSGDSPFDRWYFGGEEDAISASAKNGFKLYLAKGRCVSCHTIEQNFAIFTDHQFHNIGVGINAIQAKVPDLARSFQKAKAAGASVDVTVLGDPDTSHLGRFAVDNQLHSMGAFKTPTLRNIAVTPPYMHDGSIKTLREVIVHYNNGGVTNAGDEVNPFISGGIRPLLLTDQEIDDLVALMEAMTSPQFEMAATAMGDTP